MKKEGYFAGPAEVYAYACHIQQPIKILEAQPASSQLIIEIVQPRARQRAIAGGGQEDEATDVDASSSDVLYLFCYHGLYWRLRPLTSDDGGGVQRNHLLPAVLHISSDEARACSAEGERMGASDDEGEEDDGDSQRYHPRSRPSSYAGYSHSQFNSRTEGRRLLHGELHDVPTNVRTKHERLLFDALQKTFTSNFEFMCDAWNNHVRGMLVQGTLPNNSSDPYYLGTKTVQHLRSYAQRVDKRRRNEEGGVMNAPAEVDSDDQGGSNDGSDDEDGGEIDSDRVRQGQQHMQRRRRDQRQQLERQVDESAIREDMERRRTLTQQLSSSAGVHMPTHTALPIPRPLTSQQHDANQQGVSAGLPPPVAPLPPGTIERLRRNATHKRRKLRCGNCNRRRKGHPRGGCPFRDWVPDSDDE
jgi:hypothetical protein